MIGNDVVDLREVPKTFRKGFLEKLFREYEREAILQSNDPVAMAWSFWALKESAYKIWFRSSLSRRFNPKKFKVFPEEYGKAKIYFEDKCFNGKVQLDRGKIHALAAEKGLDEVCFEIIEIDRINKEELKHICCQQIKKHLPGKFERTPEIRKDIHGIPSLNSEDVVVSLSHHGRFGAYAFFVKKISLEA